MSTGSSRPPTTAAGLAADLPLTGNGRSSEHLKQVPDTPELRRQIQSEAAAVAATLDDSRAWSRRDLESLARDLLTRLELSPSYLGWTMVALASAFWRDQVAAVPYDRRLLLLPQCLRDAEVCRAPCDASGLHCQGCGACSLAGFRDRAQRLGYRVMIAEGSPAVMKIILAGAVDAILGVACLDVLENTLDKILLAGIPCMASPLLGNGCRRTTADQEAVEQLIDLAHRPGRFPTRTYVHLMRCAAGLFEPATLQRLAFPESTNGAAPLSDSPLGSTEAIARDFLLAGGKHSRPFVTLAAYDALTGGGCTQADGPAHVARLSDAVKATALAIEIFHKASLIHDDVEDDDWYRYGRPALHRTYGPSTAINVGDYLIGLGYRLVAVQRAVLGAEAAADLLAEFARAHTRLCEGQGAELLWRDARDKRLAPLDALKICAWKTSPAFEAALMAGIRLAGPAEPYRTSASRFARHLGVAYQILNDLDDWREDRPSNRAAGSDLLGGRPTVLWALALAGLDQADRRQLESLLAAPAADEATVARACELYTRADVFRQAAALVAKHHKRACEAADAVASKPLSGLLRFLADAILDRRPLAIVE